MMLISMHGCCHDLPWLNEFSGVVLRCFTLSRHSSWTEVLFIQAEVSRIPLFKAIVISKSCVRKRVNRYHVGLKWTELNVTKELRLKCSISCGTVFWSSSNFTLTTAQDLLMSFTQSDHFHWLWPKFKVSVVSDSRNWTQYFSVGKLSCTEVQTL